MSFVEDHDAAIRQDAGVRGVVRFQLDGKIGEKEMMVDNDNVAFGGAPAHFGNEAALVFGAFLADTSVGSGVEFVPERACFRQFG